MPENTPPNSHLRPKPQFGEIADNPPQQTNAQAPIPHNLGLSYNPNIPLRSNTAAGNSQELSQQPAEAASQSGHPILTKPQSRNQQQPSKKPTDRIITTVLLLFGAMGATVLAASLYQMPQTLNLFFAAANSNLTAPDWVKTCGLISAAVIFMLFAATLLLTLRRQKQGKIAFWIPLLGGLVATLAALTCVGFIMLAVIPPELLMDPTISQKFLEQIQHSKN